MISRQEKVYITLENMIAIPLDIKYEHTRKK
jgi:hypothetical protein